MSITPLRVSSKKLLAAIREAARSSSNVVFIPPLEKRAMAGMMTFHQALKCLQEGIMVGKPHLNDKNDWELSMERFAADSSFRIRVVAMCEGATVSKLVVHLQEP